MLARFSVPVPLVKVPERPVPAVTPVTVPVAAAVGAHLAPSQASTLPVPLPVRVTSLRSPLESVTVPVFPATLATAWVWLIFCQAVPLEIIQSPTPKARPLPVSVPAVPMM